ncbi:MAG TPA: hypothetical protein VFW23_01130 [Tepidisphaeraceae bacterium]|nr:hypothetical protein [Tepidisphaeraceae bacterium]
MKRMLSLLASFVLGSLMAALAVGASASESNGQLFEPPPVGNAALQYWQANLFLYHLDAAQKKLIEDFDTVPLDGPAAAVVAKRGDLILQYVRRGAHARSCDWGIPLEEGPNALLPQLNWLHVLCDFQLLCARGELRNGSDQPAVEDILSAMALARNTGSDNIGVELRVADALENEAIRIAASGLNRLKPDSVQALKTGLDQLPPGGSMKRAIRVEQFIGQRWTIQLLKDSPPGEGWKDKIRNALGNNADAKIQSAGGTREQIIANLEKLDPFYDQLEQFADAPVREFDAKFPALLQQYKSNPAAPLARLDQFSRLSTQQAAAETRLQMLRAAIEIVQHGPDSVKQTVDRGGNGLFTYRATADGFELRSELKDANGNPVTLVVGAPPEIRPVK